MNVRKLRKLQKWLLAEPRRFDMQTWSSQSNSAFKKQKPPCGTVGCLAGMACHMEGHVLTGPTCFLPGITHGVRSIPTLAQGILGLTDQQAARLFFIASLHGEAPIVWPEEWETKYLKAKTLKTKAKVAIKYIDYFIENEKAA